MFRCADIPGLNYWYNQATLPVNYPPYWTTETERWNYITSEFNNSTEKQALNARGGLPDSTVVCAQANSTYGVQYRFVLRTDYCAYP